MAASSKDLSKLNAILWTLLISCMVTPSLCQNGTSTNTTNVTTDATTTQPTTLTTTQPTTTPSTISPSVPGRDIPENTDISGCPCDLTGLACDVNCCCDPDCSDEDKRAFSFCLRNSYRLDDKLCFDRDVILYENGPAFSNTTNDLFCIYFDNEEERNYYVNPSLITTQAQFQQLIDDYADFTFQPSSPPTPTAEFNNFYRSGDPMYIVFSSQAFSYLGLPAALSTSSACTYGNPAAYLIDQTNNCVQSVSDLQTECTTAAAFQASSFYENLRVVRDPFLLKYFNSSSTEEDAVLGTLDLSSVSSLYDNDFTLVFQLEATDPLQCINSEGLVGPCTFTTPPATPTWDAANSVCQNVLTQVHYRFVTTGTFGVQNAFVSFVYSDISSVSLTQTFSTSFTTNAFVSFVYSDISSVSLTQTFTTSFTTTSDSDNSFKRSGRPGYRVGEPIIAGNLTQTGTGNNIEQRIVLVAERGQQLALVRPSVSGDCLTQAGQLREPVLFGQDMRTGCFIQVALQNDNNDCQLLNEAIISALEGYPVPTFTSGNYENNDRYVATFGDSNVLRTGDWVQILYQNRPSPRTSTSGQCLLSLGMDVQIIYANVGSVPNPQPKIIGVAFVYEEPQTVEYRCSGSFCQPATADESQRIEISSSVTFIDASQRPEEVEGEYPTFAVRLPYDFFYPFLNSASVMNLSNVFVVLASTALCVMRFFCGFS